MKRHEYRLQLLWEGNTGDGTATYRGYSREHRVSIAGKPDVIGSADPLFRGDPQRHNPEELLVAALASCHMLAYLALCARRGVRVEAYRDDATGLLALDGKGSGQFEEVVLAPQVTLAEGANLELATALHDEAHAECFIARSCNFPVRHRPTLTFGRAAPAAPPRGDLAVRLADRPGALAELGELLAGHAISVEGGGGFVTGDAGTVHFLVADAPRAAELVRAAGYDATARDVVVQRLDQGTPGQIGKLARAMAGAGINIEAMYSDHDHQLILVVDHVAAARDVSAAWAAGSRA
ncbi:MAG TPA: OsmC family protein [Kofleriaceae bacterium]